MQRLCYFYLSLFRVRMTRKTIQIPDTPKFVPPHLGVGDRDFWGHGPSVRVSCLLAIRNGNQLWANVYMHAVEVCSDSTVDGTEAEGIGWYSVYTHNRPITRILSDVYSSTSYVDAPNNWQDDVLPMGETELVNQFIATGDTFGPEAGTLTGVIAKFNPVMLEDDE
jgi:hypothetical protein